MTRNDVLSSARPPKSIDDFLVKKAGKNPYGEPVFRLVIAEGVLKQAGAVYYKWPKGLVTREQGGMQIDDDGRPVIIEAAKPLSVDAEVRWVRKYPDLKGWILEEWHPAHKFGTAEEWESHRVPGYPNVCTLGPYPSEGRYMLSLPYGWGQKADEQTSDHRFDGRPGVPPVSALEIAIDYVESCRQFWGNLTPANRRRLLEDTDLQQQALTEKYEHDKIAAASREVADVVLSSSLAAGRVRNEWQKSGHLWTLGHVGS